MKYDSPRQYRERLLKVLTADDIAEILNLIGEDSRGLALDNRYLLLRHWDDVIERQVFSVIKERIYDGKD